MILSATILSAANMPSKSFGKVQKQISKKRGGKPNALHQNSRDAKRLQRAGKRDDKLDEAKRNRMLHVTATCEIYMYHMDTKKANNGETQVCG